MHNQVYKKKQQEQKVTHQYFFHEFFPIIIIEKIIIPDVYAFLLSSYENSTWCTKKVYSRESVAKFISAKDLRKPL